MAGDSARRRSARGTDRPLWTILRLRPARVAARLAGTAVHQIGVLFLGQALSGVADHVVMGCLRRFDNVVNVVNDYKPVTAVPPVPPASEDALSDHRAVVCRSSRPTNPI